MGKTGVLVWLILLAAGGYALIDNWPAISQKLGLAELSPARIKAIDLAKSAFTLEPHRTNYEVIKTRMQVSTAEIQEGKWEADPQPHGIYLVKFWFKEDGKTESYAFEVDSRSRKVKLAAGKDPPRSH